MGGSRALEGVCIDFGNDRLNPLASAWLQGVKGFWGGASNTWSAGSQEDGTIIILRYQAGVGGVSGSGGRRGGTV